MSNIYFKQQGENKRKQIDEIISDELLTDEGLARKWIEKNLFFNTHAMYANMGNQLEEKFLYNEKIVELWKQNPEKRKDSFNIYISLYHNYIIAALPPVRDLYFIQSKCEEMNVQLDSIYS